ILSGPSKETRPMSQRISCYLRLFLLLTSFFSVRSIRAQTPAQSIPPFEASQDIGAVVHPGSINYDAQAHTYTLSASGENMWLTKDAFFFVWKKASGNVSISADISFIGKGTNPHRKAVLMIRQSLAPDSPYVDIALHGVGLTSLQTRDPPGDLTRQMEAADNAPTRLRLEKRGDYFTMYLAHGNSVPQLSGGSIRVLISGSFYVGIGLCSHEKDIVEQAIFSNLKIGIPEPVSDPRLYSTLETIKIDTGFAIRCNNDHGISPDGSSLVISDQSQEDHRSRIYILPIAGGLPRRITKNAPSYWHGWSPDGKTLAFVGERDGNFDIYSILIDGGEETRLTTARGLDDGPEYAPDGKFIYFNSDRSGQMQIWRMQPSGSGQERITNDAYNNWFPHISPDGKWMIILTYEQSVTGHPENKDV